MNTQPLTIEEAQRLVLEAVDPLPAELIPLGDCTGRILAEDLYADADLPAFDRSMMDGFAVRSADTAAACPDRPAYLTVIAEIAAGEDPVRPVGPGEAARIMTGAPIPREPTPCAGLKLPPMGFGRMSRVSES
ncbi:hypothetical protein N6H14_04200 [Paenibacillus sp. CC-CFT747]|nr:hypothetical protein N6H14_04200 [Paenibacillus sp. CC-CFT747]